MTNEPLPLFAGCAYVVGKGHKGKESFKIFCNKLRGAGSDYCPKHQEFILDEGKEPERKRKMRREKKENRERELADEYGNEPIPNPYQGLESEIGSCSRKFRW